MTGCLGCVTNETHCFANVSVGSQPAGIIPCGALGRRSIVAVLTDQFAPPHVSFGLRHQRDEPEERIDPGSPSLRLT